MKHFVYILYSKSLNEYNKGYSIDINRRLKEHNEGASRYSSTGIPWVVVYCKEFETKKAALIEEKRLKKLNRKSIEKLIS